jgi:hypothetical protein
MINNHFFKLCEPTLDNKRKLLHDCHNLCYDWHADTLDCSVSWRRHRNNFSFEEILDKLTDSCHFVIIRRDGRWSIKRDGQDYYEVGFSTSNHNSPDHFLFMYLTVDVFESVEKKIENQ